MPIPIPVTTSANMDISFTGLASALVGDILQNLFSPSYIVVF